MMKPNKTGRATSKKKSLYMVTQLPKGGTSVKGRKLVADNAKSRTR